MRNVVLPHWNRALVPMRSTWSMFMRSYRSNKNECTHTHTRTHTNQICRSDIIIRLCSYGNCQNCVLCVEKKRLFRNSLFSWWEQYQHLHLCVRSYCEDVFESVWTAMTQTQDRELLGQTYRLKGWFKVHLDASRHKIFVPVSDSAPEPFASFHTVLKCNDSG